MKRLYVYCEGQTEEAFVKKQLYPHLIAKDICTIPIVCITKEGPQGVYKGGIVDYNKAVKEIRRYCKQHPHETVTSFIDYYGLNNLPTLTAVSNKYELIEKLESCLQNDVGCSNFIPYLSLHEFESLLFSDPTQFGYLSADAVAKFKEILVEFGDNPEFINNGIDTAPSKRISKEIINYGKILDGNRIAERISLAGIRKNCRHFSQWVTQLESI
ncbi:MAG: DUF4276 family protein [Clostridiales bacterium]|nr:DUF4276 family protein [Clostridiales bacterium]